jgi:hypothetical protein
MKEDVHLGSLAQSVALVAIVSVVINGILTFLGKVISMPPDTFGPYFYSRVILYTIVGVIGAGVVYTLMRWWYSDTAKANRHFIMLSLVLLVLSFYPDVVLPYSTDAEDAGWTYGIIMNLMLMHVVPACLVVYFYTRKVRV